MGLEPAVINVLIDYVLRVNNQKLTKNFVLTIASQWQRLNIKTAEEAMNHALQETKQKKTKTTTSISKGKEKIVPTWFTNDEGEDKKEITTNEEEEMKDLLRGVYENN